MSSQNRVLRTEWKKYTYHKAGYFAIIDFIFHETAFQGPNNLNLGPGLFGSFFDRVGGRGPESDFIRE